MCLRLHHEDLRSRFIGASNKRLQTEMKRRERSKARQRRPAGVLLRKTPPYLLLLRAGADAASELSMCRRDTGSDVSPPLCCRLSAAQKELEGDAEERAGDGRGGRKRHKRTEIKLPANFDGNRYLSRFIHRHASHFFSL